VVFAETEEVQAHLVGKDNLLHQVCQAPGRGDVVLTEKLRRVVTEAEKAELDGFVHILQY